MSQTLFITGLNGFIGSSLLGRLLTQTNWKVIGLDLQTHKIQKWLQHPQLLFKQGDMVRDLSWIDEQIQRADVVLPLAAIANPSLYVTQPLKVFELDFEANLALVRLCAAHKKRLVFPSTSEVYGMCPDEAFEEETSSFVLGPIHKQRWIYACAKQMMDRVIYAYGFEHQLRYTLFRPFNFLGPLMDDPHNAKQGSSRAVIQFISQVLYTGEIRLVNGGTQTRCFTYIEDALDALMTILINPHGCSDGQIFNIGNPHNHHTIAEVAQTVIDIIGSFPDYQEHARRTRIVSISAEEQFGKSYEDTNRRVPSIDKARKILNWNPQTDLRSALYQTISYHLLNPSTVS